MSTFQLVQGAVIALVVVISAWVAFRKLLPKTSSRAMAILSAWLNQSGRPASLRALGKRFQPATATGSCGDGCGTCGSCGTPPAAAQRDAVPLTFKSRKA